MPALSAFEGSFLSRLWNDKQVRSLAVQVITTLAFFAFFAYIIRNAYVNLEALGKGFSYDPDHYREGGIFFSSRMFGEFRIFPEACFSQVPPGMMPGSSITRAPMSP